MATVLGVLAGLYGELREIHRTQSALATLALMNAERTEVDVPENVRSEVSN